MTTRTSLVVALLAALPAVAAAAPSPCPGGRFLLIDQAPLVAGARVRPFDAVVLEESTLAIASGCEAVAARLKAARRGQRVRAVWPRGACPNVARKVRLTARFDPSCTRLRGKLRVGKQKRRFEGQ